MDFLWMHLLKNLSQLCSDDRPEVRNSANQTLFRTIGFICFMLGMNGQLLKLDAWELCIKKVLLPLLERIRNSSQIVKQPNEANKILSPKILAYGIRSVSKGWDETKIITLSGISKCFIDFLPVMIDLPDFNSYWKIILTFYKTSCLEGSSEVSIAALKNFKILIQFPRQDSPIPEKLYLILKELWMVVWETWELLGLEMVQPLSNSVELLNLESDVTSLQLIWSDGTRPLPIQGTMSQDALSLYVSIFSEIFPIIRTNFSSKTLKRLLFVLRNLLLYQTIPHSDSTQTKIRADFVNDLESLSPLQSTILDIVAKNDFASKESPEVILNFFSDLVILPFVQQAMGPPTGILDDNNSSESIIASRKSTYMSLSKKCLQLLVCQFEEHGKRPTFYLEGPFYHVLDAFRIPLSEKYRCPKPGQKDSTPLWRSAANTAMTVINIGLGTLDTLIKGILFHNTNNRYRFVGFGSHLRKISYFIKKFPLDHK
jgi:hypothetical protein